MSSVARVTAHAKLNLALRVLAREVSGYHSIETLFLRVALGDDVSVQVCDSGERLTCTGADTGPIERNLALLAARAFQRAFAWPRGFHITIAKKIPVGGGLGGGSADAGAVLRALSALAPMPVPEERLLALALELGSDVPFLTTTAPFALAWGRGERMLALPPLPSRAVLLARPPFAVATADAYRWLAAARGAVEPVPRLLAANDLSSWESLGALAANDFEQVVGERHPEIPLLLDAMQRSGALLARMSGSGSTVFGVFAGEPPADSFPPQGLPALLSATRTLDAVTPVMLED